MQSIANLRRSLIPVTNFTGSRIFFSSGTTQLTREDCSATIQGPANAGAGPAISLVSKTGKVLWCAWICVEKTLFC
jgi:hypothetical protein